MKFFLKFPQFFLEVSFIFLKKYPPEILTNYGQKILRKLEKNDEIPKKVREWLRKFLRNFTLNLGKVRRKICGISKLISRTFGGKNFRIIKSRPSRNHQG